MKKFKTQAKKFYKKNNLADPIQARTFLKGMKHGIDEAKLPALHEQIDKMTDQEVQSLINTILTG